MDLIVNEVFVNVVYLMMIILSVDIVILIIDKVLDNISDITQLTNNFRKAKEVIQVKNIKG